VTKQITLILPNQLFEHHPANKQGRDVYLIEEFLFFKQYNFHKQKLKYHRATMMFYKTHLELQGYNVTYIDSQDKRSDIRVWAASLSENEVSDIFLADPVDDWIQRRLSKTCAEHSINLHSFETPMFINTREEISSYFTGRKRFFQTDFYIHQRKTRNILVDHAQNPIGGKWSFDDENRVKYPKNTQPPIVKPLDANAFDIEAASYIDVHFGENVGVHDFKYPSTYVEANAWLDLFFEQRYRDFGRYEDAIVDDQAFLHHSIITPMLNVGLLLPNVVIQRAIDYGLEMQIPINSIEGFVRQILGWREFIRAVYLLKGREERTRNYWGFQNKIPSTFYNGATNIKPIDTVIHRLLKTAYSHHIERLMVLGNFMVLNEIHPDEVYRWFMEMFIDAYDWVMVPNVYGMSQFADGGLMATKPYISGSNYVMKMSNFTKGPWQEIWDALFWRFMDVHRDFFLKNPRLGMLVRTYDKWDESKKKKMVAIAGNYLLNTFDYDKATLESN
jgi:deoxyribodipyrimidine photolyase-related protein